MNLKLEDSQSVVIRRKDSRLCNKCGVAVPLGPVDVSWAKVSPPSPGHVDEVFQEAFDSEFSDHVCS